MSYKLLRRDGDVVILHNMDVAIYLFAKRVPIHRAQQLNRKTHEFEFYDPEERAEPLVLEFVNKQSNLQPAEYADAQRRLKSMMHQFAVGRR